MKKLLIIPLLAAFGFAACGDVDSDRPVEATLGQAKAKLCHELNNEIQDNYSSVDNYGDSKLNEYGYMVALASDFCVTGNAPKTDDPGED